MRIAVLADNLVSGGGLSVGRNLIATLPQVAPMHRFLLITPRGLDYGATSAGDMVEVLETHPGYSNPRGALESLLRVHRAIRRFSPDLVLSLGNVPLPKPPCPQALLVHDPHLFYPEANYRRELWFEKRKKQALAGYLRRHLDAVELVFCQTETAAGRFRACFDYENVAVMPNAVSALISQNVSENEPPTPVAQYAARFKLFALTKYYPHKNLELIIDAYRLHPELTAGTVCFLTIAPSRHPGVRALLRRIRDEVPDVVVNIGPLHQSDIGSYYRRMDAVVHPTTLESFSATYLEAMAFGLPIITSDLDFAHEICREAALYVDPDSPLALAQSIAALRDDGSVRSSLVHSGSLQLARRDADWPTIARVALDRLGVSHT